MEQWLQLAPFDRRAHEMLLATLARCGRIREGEEHLATTAGLFEAEGLDCTPIRDAWRSARALGTGPAPAPGAALGVTAGSSGRDDGVRAAPRRASIAVMPFVDQSMAPDARGGAAYAAAIRRTVPRYSIADFLGAFRFDPHGAELFRAGAKRIDMA